MSSSVEKNIESSIKDKSKALAKGNYKEASNCCNYIGHLYTKLGDHENALDEHKQELQYSKKTKSLLDVSVAYRKLSECYSQLNEFEKALKCVRLYYQIVVKLNNVIEQERALVTLGRTHLLQVEQVDMKTLDYSLLLDGAEKAFRKAFDLIDGDEIKKLCDQKQIQNKRMKLFRNISMVYDLRGDFDEAISTAKEALLIADSNILGEDVFEIHLTIGDMARRKGDDNLAERQLANAESCAKSFINSSSTGSKDALKDIYLSQILMYSEIQKFASARHCVKKLVKKIVRDKSKCVKEYELDEILSTIDALKQSFRALKNARDNPVRAQIFETIGDLYAGIECYRSSVASYLEAYELSKKCDKKPKQLLPLVVSIAQTFMDLREYSQAIDYFTKEIKLRQPTEHHQKSATYVNMAICASRRPGREIQVEEFAKNAVKEAEKISHCNEDLKYALEVLKNYYAIHNHTFELDQVKERLKIFDNWQKEDSSESESEEVLSASEQELRNSINQLGLAKQEVDLDDLSDVTASESEDAEEFDRFAARKRKKKFRRNEKGEWPLSVAVIRGQMKTVERLVEEEKHPVNDCQDNGGWLPLHEAANFDFVEIAKFLLDHKADIDVATVESGHTTPLMSAAAGGAFKTLRLLVESGANVFVRNDIGQNALDILNTYFKDAARSADEVNWSELEAVKELLVERMATGSGSKEKMNPRTIVLSSGIEKSPFVAANEDQVEQEIVPNGLMCEKSSGPAKFSFQEESESGKDLYRNALAHVRSSAVAREKRNIMAGMKQRAKYDASSDEDDYDDKDGWLVQDKKKRVKQKPKTEAPKTHLSLGQLNNDFEDIMFSASGKKKSSGDLGLVASGSGSKKRKIVFHESDDEERTHNGSFSRFSKPSSSEMDRSVAGFLKELDDMDI